jgi:hypothetical protein
MLGSEQKKLFEELDTRYYRVNENFSELAAEFRSYQTESQLAQPTASPNGGPAALSGNSGVSGGPPSVS